MAYVDHTFSITDEEETATFFTPNRAPVKEISLATACIVLGSVGLIVGLVMMYNRVGGDKTHGIAFSILGATLFLPGLYYSRTAYYAYKGYRGFSFSGDSAAEFCSS